MNVLHYSIIIFISQLVFIYCRTWNVKAIAQKDIPQVLISGAFVHLSWLVGIAIGAASMHEIITDFKYQYLPIIFFSTLGGLIGSYVSMKRKPKYK